MSYNIKRDFHDPLRKVLNDMPDNQDELYQRIIKLRSQIETTRSAIWDLQRHVRDTVNAMTIAIDDLYSSWFQTMDEYDDLMDDMFQRLRKQSKKKVPAAIKARRKK
jgi:hypothetical protein